MVLKAGLILTSLLPVLIASSHAPIVIQSDSDFASCGCVSGGTGSPANPFIIGPWSLNKVAGIGISIDGTNLTKSFVISNVTIAGNASSSATGIVLNHINPGGAASIVARVSGTQTSIQSLGVGILVENSSHLALDGGGASGNVAGTADFIGYLVADPLPGTVTLATYGASHNNLIEANISHTDGPTGNEVHSNVVPAFLGGFVVLNGTYNNVIRHNQDWASTGSGFAWAQAVPDSTPIGVSTYPPTLHCNVTASEGGGGGANLNGNTWTGNTFRTMDPCLPAQ